MKKIGVLTSGGDSQGMNAAVYAVVRYGIEHGMQVYLIHSGYQGLIDGKVTQADAKSVEDIIHRGGTVIQTSRCPDMKTEEGQKKAVNTLKRYGIEGLVVIGGDGSFRGALDLYKKFGVKAVGIPGTIDNDLAYTDFTLGFDTSVNTVVSAINNLRDTMTSHDRVCIIEVMGRKCGDIALYAGICGGAEIILVPEVPFDLKQIVKKINLNQRIGKSSDIIVLAEGVCKAEDLKKQLQENGITGSIKTTTLGYIQRGGAPTMADRVLSARCAVRAVDLLMADKGGRVVGIKDNKIVDEDIEEALKKKGKFDDNLYQTAMILGL